MGVQPLPTSYPLPLNKLRRWFRQLSSVTELSEISKCTWVWPDAGSLIRNIAALYMLFSFKSPFNTTVLQIPSRREEGWPVCIRSFAVGKSFPILSSQLRRTVGHKMPPCVDDIFPVQLFPPSTQDTSVSMSGQAGIDAGRAGQAPAFRVIIRRLCPGCRGVTEL